MKFSLWLEKREVRNQKSELKMPKRKSKQELARRAAASRIEQMAGRGDAKTYGKAGTSDSGKQKDQARAKSKHDFNRKLRSGDF